MNTRTQKVLVLSAASLLTTAVLATSVAVGVSTQSEKNSEIAELTTSITSLTGQAEDLQRQTVSAVASEEGSGTLRAEQDARFASVEGFLE